MENTTNYGLRKYQSGDLFNPLTVNNPNIDDIDTDMKAISDRAIGRATELVSQGVHAITLLDTDCKTFKFVATGNYSAGETFTVNGIQANAYTPSGSALVSNAFVTGSIVLGTLNEDGTAITFYVTGSAVADDSLKLGGELPSYYATQSDMTSANTDITNLKNQAGNTSIVGIGDGTLSGAVSSLNNDLTDYIKPIITMTNEITISGGASEVLTISVPSVPSGYKPIMAIYFNNSGSNDIVPVTASTVLASDATSFPMVVKNVGTEAARTTVRAYVLFIRN